MKSNNAWQSACRSVEEERAISFFPHRTLTFRSAEERLSGLNTRLTCLRAHLTLSSPGEGLLPAPVTSQVGTWTLAQTLGTTRLGSRHRGVPPLALASSWAAAGRGWGAAGVPPPWLRAAERESRAVPAEGRARRGRGSRGGGWALRVARRDVTRLRRPCGPADPRRERRPEGSRSPAARPCACCCRRYCCCLRPRLRAAQVSGWRPGRLVRDADASGPGPPPAQHRVVRPLGGFAFARAEREVRGSARTCCGVKAAGLRDSFCPSRGFREAEGV